MKPRILVPLVLSLLFLISACTGIPDGVTAVSNFDSARYLGSWYEIARLDHSFERGLSKVTAQYSRRNDGGIKVINRGYDLRRGEWSEAEGRAYFTGSPDVASLKVSFFGPFYGGYNVIALDHENYLWALVCGNSRDYLWILSRTPSLDDDTLKNLLKFAREQGFDTEQLIYVSH